jgi:hypothetical protein
MNTMNAKMLFALSLGIAGMAWAAQQAVAQTRNCAVREVIVSRLADRYGESRQGIGLGQDNSVIEVFASAETGTWTILVTLPSGVACLVASGEAWERLAEAPLPGEGA